MRTPPPRPAQTGRGVRALAGDDGFSVHEAVGGPRGIAETTVPGVLFVLVYGVVSDLRVAIWAAVGVAAALTLARLVRRDSPQQALSGLLGVAVCAWWAARSGRAADFYLPGLYINVGYALAYTVSILVRWPILGLILGPLLGENLAWRKDPARLRAYQRASWLWVGLFVSRLAVQWPLYQADLLGPLATARLAMGLPLFALTIYLSWLVLRGTAPTREAVPADGAAVGATRADAATAEVSSEKRHASEA